MKRIISLFLALATLACTPLLFASCGPNQKSATIPVDYMVTYTLVNAYGEELQITVGENQRDYEDDYYYFSNGEIEVIEKKPHGNGISSYWIKDLSTGSNAQFELADHDTFVREYLALYNLRLFHIGTYTGAGDSMYSSGGVDWKTAGELTEIEFGEKLDSLDGGLLAGREVTFYSFNKTNAKNGPATIALDNKYAFVMYYCLETAPEPLDKAAALENDRYDAAKTPISMLLCTSCLLDDEAPIIQDMLP